MAAEGEGHSESRALHHAFGLHSEAGSRTPLRPLLFHARRSPVLATRGMVACTQPIAAKVGVDVLERGGNAVDAAVAVAAAMNVTEPTSTGIGGDCFALFYSVKDNRVYAMNGSGRAPAELTIDRVRADCFPGAEELPATAEIPLRHPHTITVPGAAAGWVDAIGRWGTMPLAEVLAPAIRLCDTGVPVSPITAEMWHRGEAVLKRWPHPEAMLVVPGGRAPAAGEIHRKPDLGRTFRALAEHGKDGFYNGSVADAIVAAVRREGGLLTREDLREHTTSFVEPLSVSYGDRVRVYECPPNGQGIAALMALNILDGCAMGARAHNSADYLHYAVEAMRLAFADARQFVADPDAPGACVPAEGLLSKDYARERRALIHPERATADVVAGRPLGSSDTVSFQVVDAEGNACSFINSNYHGFGTGLIPDGCGFTLQNRGANFSLDPGHANALAPRKRPYHTIIPGMALRGADGREGLYASFSVMGGFMQPQGHAQVMLNLLEHGLDPQSALDAPRFCLAGGSAADDVSLEDGLDGEACAGLEARGHRTSVVRSWERSLFGRGQIILRADNGVLWGGSDGRGDGCAIGIV